MKTRAKKRGRKKTTKKKAKRRVGASKKRASKKKATKKKATKKRAGKKKAAKKKPGSKAKNTVNIKNSKASKLHQHLKMNKATNKPQSVHWHGKDKAYRLTFTGQWPFSESPDSAPQTITVPAGGDSNQFTADTNGTQGHQYKYVVFPPPPRRKSKKPKKKPNPDVVLDD